MQFTSALRKFSEENQQVAMKRWSPLPFYVHLLFALLSRFSTTTVIVQ
jgi:hypothetical protein